MSDIDLEQLFGGPPPESTHEARSDSFARPRPQSEHWQWNFERPNHREQPQPTHEDVETIDTRTGAPSLPSAVYILTQQALSNTLGRVWHGARRRPVISMALALAVAGGITAARTNENPVTLVGGSIVAALNPDNTSGIAPLNCLSPALAARATSGNVSVSGDLLQKITVIDSNDPSKQEALTKARQQAFSDPNLDPKKLAQEGLLSQGLFNDGSAKDGTDVQARVLPAQAFSTDTKQTINRRPKWEFTDSSFNFALCKTGDGQLFTNKLGAVNVDLSQLSLNYLPSKDTVNRYEPVPFNGTNVDSKESIMTMSDRLDALRVVNPGAQFDPKKGFIYAETGKNNGKTAINPAITTGITYLALSELTQQVTTGDSTTDFSAATCEYMKDLVHRGHPEVSVICNGNPTTAEETYRISNKIPVKSGPTELADGVVADNLTATKIHLELVDPPTNSAATTGGAK